MSCLLLALTIGAFFGLHFQAQPVYAAANETHIADAFRQDGDVISADDMFEDYTQTSLRKEYRDEDVLGQLMADEQITAEQYSRAVDVLNGNIKFTPKREFSTEFENDNKIDQAGDIAAYSQTELKCIWKASEIILTGIYGMQEETFNIFVEANESDKLPSIFFSQNHGYYTHWYEERQLKKGWNILEFPAFGRGLVAKDEILGGAVYLCNPYLPEEQGEVKVYIEGGGYYPVFRKGGNEKEFLGLLARYEDERKSKTMPDMAELVTDHAIISTTSSSLYDVYFNNDVITPSENLNLWGDYFTQLFEFNGIPTSEKSDVGRQYDKRNDYVRINLRYMTYYQGSGAYSYSYHIGWYYEHYWFANFYNALDPIKDHKLTEHLIFGIGHELGHALDNEPRKINETTNNFTAAMAYFNIVGMPHYEQYQPFEKTFKALSNDFTLNYMAYDDGQVMYTKQAYPTNYDHNYLIWWDLEAVFPGFWARFNNYFREPIKKAGLTTTELYVYYSSLATGVDLSDYYERWGFYYGKKSNVSERFVYENASEAFKDAMQEALDNKQISKQYDHFWYVDGAQYNFMLEHENVAQEDREYENGKPTISKIVKSGNEHTIFINSNKDEYHLGYEIFSKVNNEDWKLAGFTYTSSFVDKHYYASAPAYKAIAINRFFKASDESEPKSDAVTESSYVCKVGDVFYDDLSTAITAAEDGSTIYLLDNCRVNSKYIVKNLTLRIDDGVNNDIYIYSSDTTSMFVVQANFSIIGKDNAKIIFDGGNCKAGNPAIYGTSHKVIIKNAVFRNFNTVFLAGAVYSTGSDLEIYDTSFEACRSAKGDAAISVGKTLVLDNCAFSNNLFDVHIPDLENLTLANQHSAISLTFDKFEGEKAVAVKGDASEIAQELDLKIDGYMAVAEENRIVVKPLSFKLKFNLESSYFEYSVNDRTFVFGDEDSGYDLQETQYFEYEERGSGKKYKTGDKIVVDKDLEFDVKIKDKLGLKIFYKNEQSLNYYPYGEEIYLPTVDGAQNKVFAYRGGNEIYESGQIYTLESNSVLTAIYLGNLTYRYIVKGEVYSVGYGSYGQNIELLKLEEEEFLGWKIGAQIVSGSTVLKGDTDFIAMFDGEADIYDLDSCEIDIVGTYTYSGGDICPQIIVYFNESVVPESCYTVSYSNNVSASEQAQVKITFVEGLSTGSKTRTFTILPKLLEKNDVNVNGLQNFVYNGAQTEQDLTITYEDKQINDFSIEYIGDRTNAGNVQVKITFSGNYTGEFYLVYTISKAEHPDQMPDRAMTIDRKTKTLQDVALNVAGWQWEDPLLKIDGDIVKAYAVYSDTANYVNYRIEITLSKEAPKDVSELSVELEVENFVYNGVEKTPQIIAKDGEVTLTLGIDYDVQYKDNKFAGQGKVIVTFKNDYSGTKELEFTISKAQKPSVSDTTIRLDRKAAKLSDIQLPSGYMWENGNLEITSDRITAKAIYIGDDADNYMTKEIYFEIIIDAPQNEPKTNNLIWLAIVVPVGVLLVGFVVFAIAWQRKKHRRNR